MEYCLIPFQFPDVQILYPLKAMFSGGIKSEHLEKLGEKRNKTTNLFERVEIY